MNKKEKIVSTKKWKDGYGSNDNCYWSIIDLSAHIFLGIEKDGPNKNKYK